MSGGLTKKSYKSLVFTAILVGFPLSNLLIFLGSQLFQGGGLNEKPRNGGLNELSLPLPVAGKPSVVAKQHNTLHDTGYRTDATIIEEWPRLHNLVEQNAAYKTYESFYNSGSQSWRIQKYGRICIVADSFLGAVVSSGIGTALT
eukprot:CAMPEP_0198208902 /NCGR_PEP_ID=MMETSP1445-20131203/12245_1 /TAXON_ID=36898 /ORGANISM="Pyramimonas sp., Strain CCMP2087" /LENGTH=144 /DNA_ID=CAMNT_0043882485 /DNA_START=456 /DNA_END=887 /DNA_ORIENTATION=-